MSAAEEPVPAAHVPHLAAQWRAVRRLYPIYVALATQFGLGIPPFENLDGTGEHSEPELVERVETWFGEMDQRIQVHHLRQLLQSAGVSASEEKLQALIRRHLDKTEPGDADHLKLDFLLVQYFAVCAPPSFQDRDAQVEDVAEVLEPVVGRCDLPLPEWLAPLESWGAVMKACRSLADLQQSGIVQQGRQLRELGRDKQFGAPAFVAFTRFSYLLRRTFFHLINCDLKVVEVALDQLEARGVSVLDGSRLQMPVAVSMQELRRFCRNYKKPAVPDYSVDVSITRLIALRDVVEKALAETAAGSQSVAQQLAAQLEARIGRIEQELVELRKIAAELVTAASAAPRPAAEAVAGASPAPLPIPEVSPAGRPVAAGAESAPAEPVAAAPAPAPPNLNAAVEEIRKKLTSGARKGVSSISVAGTALPLSPDEVDAFTRPAADAIATGLQRSLAARAVLILAMEKRKRTGAEAGFQQVIQMCRAEAQAIQQHTGEKKIPALALSANQLLMLVSQAERLRTS